MRSLRYCNHRTIIAKPVSFAPRIVVVGLAGLVLAGPVFGPALRAANSEGGDQAVQSGEVDAQGVRKFSEVPPIGVHPRVLLSPRDIPSWRERVISTHKGMAFFSKPYQSKVIDTLAAINPGATDEELLTAFPNPGPVHDLLLATMEAIYHQDGRQKAKVAKAVTNFARVVLARSRVNPPDPRWGTVKDDVNGLKGVRGISTGLGQLWYRGGESFALSYDFLYNDMSPEQQETCRLALATATKDLMSWGMGYPKGRAVTNWYGYHGEFAIMMLAIEGEEGFDQAHYDLFPQLLHNWFDSSLYPDGGGNEDGYMGNTSMREGTFAMIAMARRGDDLFHHPNYLPYWTWAVQSLIPGEHGGETVSYACNALNPYESFPTLSRWAMPGNPLVNYYFRQYKGGDYSLHNQWQYADMSTLLAMDWEDTDKLPTDPAKLNLPLTAEFARLGLMITRSDWTPDCLYLNFYCRQDAWMNRHENIDRGRFIVCADGREWIGNEWQKAPSPDNQTIIHIDGKSQDVKVPNGNMAARFDSPAFTAGCMDLKRSYDWQWTDSFKTPGDGWEPETSTLEELGWPWKSPAVPPALHGADDPNNPQYGFSGTNFWRKPYNPVRFAFRTCALARGAHPYVIVIDDIQKDDQKHQYDSYLQVLSDVVLNKQADGSYVLSETSGPRKMLLRLLGNNEATVIQEKGRVEIQSNSVSPDFKVLLYPFKEGQTLPAISTDPAKGTAMLKWADQQDDLSFAREKNGLTRLTIKRGGEQLFGGFTDLKIHPSAPIGKTN